jgi:hypothetical protein
MMAQMMQESKVSDHKDAFNHAVLTDQDESSKASVIKLALLLKRRGFPQEIFTAPGARKAFEDNWNHMLRYEDRTSGSEGESADERDIDLFGEREIDLGCVVYDFQNRLWTYR